MLTQIVSPNPVALVFQVFWKRRKIIIKKKTKNKPHRSLVWKKKLCGCQEFLIMHPRPHPPPVTVVSSRAELNIQAPEGPMLALEVKKKKQNRASEKLSDLSEVTWKCLEGSSPEPCLQIPVWYSFQILKCLPEPLWLLSIRYCY